MDATDFIIISYNCLCVFLLVVIIVTAGPYLESFSIPATASGVAIGVFPLVSALMHLPLYFVLRRVSVPVTGCVFCLVNALGSLVYALAGPARAVALVFVGRTINGLVMSPLLTATYISRRFQDATDNQEAQRWFAVLAVLAYVVSALIAGVNEVAWSAGPSPGASRDVFTLFTTPGWILTAISLLLSGVFLRVRIPPSTNEAAPERTRSVVGIVFGTLCTFSVATIFAGWNVHAINEPLRRYGWSSTVVPFFVAGIVAASIPFFFCVSSKRPARNVVLFGAITSVGGVLTIDYDVSRGVDVALFTIGSLMISTATVLRRASTFYLANDGGEWKSVAVTVNSVMYELGLATGAIITPLITGHFGVLVAVLAAIEAVLGLALVALEARRPPAATSLDPSHARRSAIAAEAIAAAAAARR